MSNQHTRAWDGQRHPLFGVQPTGVEGPVNVRSAVTSKTLYGSIIRDLAAKVGGLDALEQLVDTPIADEPFRWTGVESQHLSLIHI